jgi:glucuronokinase
MSTGRSVVTLCPARAALAGNPSDGYGGAVVAIPLPEFQAMASATEADAFAVSARDPDLAGLLTATADAFAHARGPLPAVTLSASTTIPRSVGLAGSSALVIAVLRALAAAVDQRWEPVDLARFALAIERDRLGIEAGLQDRLVQAVGELVAMTFDPVTYTVLTPPTDLVLFVAFTTDGAEPSDTLHRSLRRRHDSGDPAVTAAMRDLAAQAERARQGIETEDLDLLGDAINRTWEIRASIVTVDDLQHRLVSIGRRLGAAVNSAGSGGSVVGLARSVAHRDEIRARYESDGFEFCVIDWP